MKKTKLILLAFICFFLITIKVQAEDISTLDGLTACLKTDGSTCKLTEDIIIEGSVLETENEVILDLNGHIITPSNDLTFTGGLVLVNYGSKLTVNDSVGTGKIKAGDTDNLYAAIQLTKKGTTADAGAAKLIINAGTIEGYYYAVTGNGGRHNTEITINGGTLNALCNEDSTAIFHPQNGALLINNGTITGGTGIEMRAGDLTVNGGTIAGTLVPTVVTPNGSGSTTTGAGIAIAQHTTKLPINVTINGGTIKGFTALYEANPQNNAATDLEKITISVTGGVFEAINSGTSIVYSEDKTEFISGGSFSINIDNEYVKDKYIVESSNSKYVVKENKEIKTENEDVTLESEEALSNKYVLVVTEISGTDLESAKEAVQTKYKDNKAIKDLKLLALYDISVKEEDEVVKLSDGRFKITLTIDNELSKYDNYKVIYIDDTGSITEIIDADIKDGKIVFTTTHLSTYGVIGYNNVPEKNPKTGEPVKLNAIDIIIMTAITILAGVITFTVITEKNKRKAL